MIMQQNKKVKKAQGGYGYIFIGLLVLVVLIVLVFMFYNPLQPQQQQTGAEQDETAVQEEGFSGEFLQTGEGPTRIFRLTARNYEFSQPILKAKQGEFIKIELLNEEGFHDWTIFYGSRTIATQRAQQSQRVTAEFRATDKGTYEFYCSVGNHRQLGMRGAFIVD
jgi:plastocyanin